MSVGEGSESRYGVGVVEAHDRIRAAILHGELPAGQVMSQLQLVETLGIGRTPVREALRVLQHEGLIISEPNRRVRIAKLSVADVEQLYVVRVIVEAFAIRMTVPQLTPSELAELEGFLAQMDHFAARGEALSSEAGPHPRFHAMLVSGVGERVSRLLAELDDHAARYRRAYLRATPGSTEIQSREHRGIVDAVQRRDGDQAAERLVAHYVRTARGVIEQLDADHEALKLAEAVTRSLTPSRATTVNLTS